MGQGQESDALSEFDSHHNGLLSKLPDHYIT